MDDLISRQAAIETLKRVEGLTRAFGYHNVIDTIRELPSAQPERKKGKWLPIIEADELGEPYQAGAQCSECGEMYAFDFNFCPICGADCRGDNNETD